jgi:excisionase family DNA binding protein
MLLTPDLVAERLDVHVETVRRMIKDGRLPALRLGTGRRARLRIDEADLLAFLDSSKTHQEPH